MWNASGVLIGSVARYHGDTGVKHEHGPNSLIAKSNSGYFGNGSKIVRYSGRFVISQDKARIVKRSSPIAGSYVPVSEGTILSALVPDFPFRYVEQIRDFVAPSVPRLEGFNANDLNSVLIPDIINPNNTYAALIIVALIIAIISWERQHPLLDHHEKQLYESMEEEDDETSGSKSNREDLDNAGRPSSPPSSVSIRRDSGSLRAYLLRKSSSELLNKTKLPENVRETLIRRERRRGLAWLALVTALTIWCTGIVNVEHPFQP